VLVVTAFELVSHHRPKPENISLCISFCAFVLCLYFITKAMEEHSNSFRKQFVFVDEVLIKKNKKLIILKFQLWISTQPHHFASERKRFLGECIYIQTHKTF